ncbi:MAG: transcriptional regulator [Streptosporangiaceae bacterium]
MSEPNILLGALIEDAGLSHAGLAARLNRLGGEYGLTLGYDHASVARWIRGRAIPRGSVPDLICDILGSRLGRVLTLSDVGMDRDDRYADDVPLTRAVDRAVALWRSDSRCPDLFAGTATSGGAAAIAPVFEWENPPYDVDTSHDGHRPTAEADVRQLRDVRRHYEHMYRRVGGLPTRPRIVNYLNRRAAPLLKGSYGDGIGRQAFRAVGSLVALAGVCAYDADMQALAQKYLFHALRMAKASADRGFGGYVVALLANQALHLGNHRLVVQYGETAQRAAPGYLTAALLTDLYALQAKAYARMGERNTCYSHMRKSENMATHVRGDGELPETDYVQPGLVECQHAEALRRLGDLTAAQACAEEAVRTADTAHTRGRVHRLATLALVLAARGEVGRSAEAARRMLQHSEGMESCRIHDRLRAVVTELRPWRAEPNVSDLVERANTQLHVPLS